jgi:glycosyltransferase involved in cell wall biosynthesis
MRVAVIADLREEHWPSMDLVADMLVEQLQREYGDRVEVTKICPEMKRRFTSGQSAKGEEESGRWFNADRFLNRYWDYPRYIRSISRDFDLFHIVDHSYSQLVRELPPNRSIVTCHDLDTFKCLLQPEKEPRSIFFRAMMKRTLSGFRKAGFVTCPSKATRDQILEHKVISADRLVVVPNGVHPSSSPEANSAAGDRAADLLRTLHHRDTQVSQRTPQRDRSEVRDQKSEVRGQRSEISEGELDLLHVGSTIPRKRIDLLLRVFAEVKRTFPSARLLRVGGPFTTEQEQLARELNVRGSIVVLPHLEREVLAAVYRRATLVLLTSEREGFGLPVIEALACGTPVVASDLPALREVGSDAVQYCSLTDIDSWTRTITELTNEQNKDAERWTLRKERALAQARRFSWAEYARAMVDIYQRVLSAPEVLPSKHPVSVQHAPNLFGPTA